MVIYSDEQKIDNNHKSETTNYILCVGKSMTYAIVHALLSNSKFFKWHHSFEVDVICTFIFIAIAHCYTKLCTILHIHHTRIIYTYVYYIYIVYSIEAIFY